GTGNSLANTLIGNTGANVLDGGTGNDSLSGGAGNDTYLVDSTLDVVTDNASEGTDTVQSSVTWTLGTNTENLTLTSASAVNGTGNALANQLMGNSAVNTLTGNAGNDRLDGAAGADAMTGGAGDDTYVVDNVGDTMIEVASGGADAVESSISWALATEIEKLTLTGTATINATGNALANTLIGNAGINRLDGAAGADAMTGGAGNDTYVVDNVGDTTIEIAAGGSDAVESSLSWTLAAEVEKLTLTGTAAINGTGNALANTLVGNAGINRLDGAAGADAMTGGVGNDTYVVDNVGDTTIEVASGGSDAVESSISWTLAAEVEKLTLTGTTSINGTGNSLANTLIGNAGANRLDGGAGIDSMTGGAGNDTYVVDVAGDVITEAVSGGTDTVESSVTWTLAAESENLTLTGASNINGTGNAVVNALIGNAGINRLDGGTGADAMTGGAGDDTYVVDNVADTTIEVAAGGSDAVESSLSWTLAAEVEKLTLTGTATVTGTGNALANQLVGNSAANTLTGNAGDDSLNGAAGADTLIGGAGNDSYTGGAGADVLTDTDTTSNDIYVWGRGEGADSLTDSGGTDRLDILAGVTEEQIWLRHVGNNLELSVIGTSDSLTINGWYTSTANRVESFKLSDGQALQASQVQRLVDAMAAFAPPAAGQTTLPANYQTALNPVIAPSWA
ncbi:MAG: calcium-binding protein, partial [Pseudomonadota bacterium]|nr:calcium-binding protein [Pseudomonadota bacterium]